MRKVCNIVVLIALLAGMLVVPASSNVALAQEATPKEPGELNVCKEESGESESGEDCNCRERYNGDLLAVIVPCIREEVKAATARMVDEFDDYLNATIFAFLALVVAIFGVRVLTAEGDPKKDAFILLIKIGAVVMFTNNFAGIVNTPFDIMQQGVQFVTEALPISSEECEEYVQEVNSSGRGEQAEEPWVFYDCVLGKLMGFADETFLGASMLGITAAALWSGQFGTVLFMGAVTCFFFLLKLIIRGTYTYLMAVMALAFLIVISPLLIPLVWMPATQQYFDRWLNAFIAVIVMPMIVIAYLMLSFTLLDKIVFDEEMGIATLMDAETVPERWRGRETSNSGVAQQVTVNDGRGVNQTDLAEESQQHPLVAALAGTGDTNIMNRLYTIDFRSDEAGTTGKIFFGMIALILMTYLLMAMFEQLIQLAQVMLGGGFFMQAAVTDNPFERGLMSAQVTMQKSLSGATGGSDFAGRLAQGVVRLPVSVAQGMVGNR